MGKKVPTFVKIVIRPTNQNPSEHRTKETKKEAISK